MAKNFTRADFDREVMQGAGVVLVDFWAAWCGPCKMVSPIIDQLSSAYSTRIINLRDGLVKEDSNPYEHLQTSKNSERTEKQKKAKKPSMSFLTALSLSLNNLSSKAVNVVMIGALCSLIGIEYDTVLEAVRRCVPQKLLEVNERALNMGYKYR